MELLEYSLHLFYIYMYNILLSSSLKSSWGISNLGEPYRGVGDHHLTHSRHATAC